LGLILNVAAKPVITIKPTNLKAPKFGKLAKKCQKNANDHNMRKFGFGKIA
jgi:hypothetical protein